jgi:predicted dehydrogenase
MIRTVNVALVGYAFMGKAHSNAYRQVAPYFSPRLTPRLKVICGRNAANVEQAARTYGWEESATDWRQVVRRKDIDLVDVSTPGDSHAEIAIEAARAGKAVICEKPLANTVAEAQRMLNAASSTATRRRCSPAPDSTSTRTSRCGRCRSGSSSSSRSPRRWRWTRGC